MSSLTSNGLRIWLSNFDIEDVLSDIVNSCLDLRHWPNHR